MSGDERVLGIPRSRAPAGASWRGIAHGDVGPFFASVATHGTYRPRSDVEDDPSWKQIIPYAVLRDRGRIFLMRRTRAGTDTRLHERHSIGVGGHVDAEDGDIHRGLAREWSEELAADWTPEFRLVGLLNDDTDPVGAVHLGIVYLVEAKGRAVEVRETHKLKGSFVTPVQVLRVYDRLETWSSLVYDFLTGRTSGVRL